MGKRNIVRRNCTDELVTILDAFHSFIEDKQARNLSKTSIIDYEDSFRYFMNYFGFDEYTPIHEINESMFKQWTRDMLERDIRPSSINRYLRDCKVFVNWCINNALLFLPSFKIDMVKGQEGTVKAFPDDDIALILQKPLDKNDFIDWRTWTVINWILATGNRASTVCSIRIGDLDFRNREITLRHTKNKKAQIIPLSHTLERIIKEYMHTWRSGCTSEDFLFPNMANEELTPDALSQAFAKYCKKRGSSHTNIHGLRHSFALNWIRNGGNQFKLQRILGHSSLEMTKRYVALAAVDLKEDYDKYAPLDAMTKVKKPTKNIFSKF